MIGGPPIGFPGQFSRDPVFAMDPAPVAPPSRPRPAPVAQPRPQPRPVAVAQPAPRRTEPVAVAAKPVDVPPPDALGIALPEPPLVEVPSPDALGIAVE